MNNIKFVDSNGKPCMIRVKQGRAALANPHLTRQGGVMGFILTYLTPRIIFNRAEARHLIVNKGGRFSK